MSQLTFYIEKVTASAWKRLDMRPPCDLSAVCQFLGIRVLYQTPPTGGRGFWLYDADRRHTIYVAPSLPRKEQRVVIAHEIGHSLLREYCPGVIHRGHGHYRHNSHVEAKCDEFARHLLVPGHILRMQIEDLKHSTELDRTAMLAFIFDVRFDYMKRRLRELDRARLP